MFPENNFSDELPQVLSFISSQLDRLGALEQQLESQPHQQKLFYTKCSVMTKVCSVIINGDVCTNLASTYMVEKLGLTTTPHPHPYRFQRMDGEGEVTVREQVQIPFKIGGYVDTVTCDVIPMQSSHMLLGKPWQLGRGTAYECHKNIYTLRYKGRKFHLIPMTPEQIREAHEEGRARLAAYYGVTAKVVAREIVRPRELPSGEADPTTLHLIRETPEPEREHLIPVEVYNLTVVEQPRVGRDSEDSTKVIQEQPGQVEIVSLKIDDIQLDNNHPIVVGKEGSVSTIVELDVVWESWYHDPSGRWWDNQWLDHVTTTWVAVGKLPRPEIIPIEGSGWLQMPFDPGKFQHFLHQFNFCCCLV